MKDGCKARIQPHEAVFDGLDEHQAAAVLSAGTSILIVAGPGSGKTKTLTHRIAYLMKERLIPQERILAVTFTRKAAHEMRERLRRLLGIDTGAINIETIHSFCLKILRRDIHHLGMKQDFSIYSGKDRLSDSLEMEGRNLLGFDDLISLTIKLFERRNGLLEDYRKLYQYIFVDEYQDIDSAQRHLLKLLSGSSANVYAIGDPDQAIYSFRGANVENFLLYEKEYQGTEIVKFINNYRSTSVIVDASAEVIKRNSRRIERLLKAVRDGGDRIQIYTVPDERDEGRVVIKEIERLMGATSHYSIYRRGENTSSTDSSYSFSDFAVLFRLNAQIKRVEDAFEDSGIPYQIVGKKNIFSREETRAIISYLHIIDNPEEDIHALEILNIPNRHLGPQAIAEIRKKAGSLGLSIYELISRRRDGLSLNRVQKEGLADLTDVIDRLHSESKEMNVSAVVRRVIKDTGLDGFYKVEGNFSDLISMAVQYDDYPQRSGLRSFLDDIELSSDADYYDEEVDAVSLMTIHAAKGLEFRVVFMCGVEEGIIPYTLHSEDVDMEEERRLFYVGMTRAIERLYLINARERFLFGEQRHFPPSSFIHNIPEGLKDSHILSPSSNRKENLKKKEKQLRLF